MKPVLNSSSGGTLVPYFLDETKNWALDINSLKQAVQSARANGKHVRGLVFINPGNPTGAGQRTAPVPGQLVDPCGVIYWLP